MKFLIFALCLLPPSARPAVQAQAWQPSPGHQQMPLWPGAVPDALVDAQPELAETVEGEHLVAGKPWTATEDDELLRQFDSGLAVEALAAAHERTRAGIEARLVKHGRLDERTARGGHGLRYATKDRAPAG